MQNVSQQVLYLHYVHGDEFSMGSCIKLFLKNQQQQKNFTIFEEISSLKKF